MAYRFGIGDYARLGSYAEEQLDIIRLSQVNEAMLTALFGMKKLGVCPVVREKKFTDEILSSIFRQDRDFDYGRLKPSPSHVVVEDAHFPKCICQEFYDDSKRRIKVVSFYQVADPKQLGEEMSEEVGAQFGLSPEAKKQLSEQFVSQFGKRIKKIRPRLDSFMMFYGDWRHYDISVYVPGSEKFEAMKQSLDNILRCPNVLDSDKQEFYIFSDASGFLLDQLFDGNRIPENKR